MDRKPIFDTVRRLLGRGFKAREISAIDAAIDAALRADDACIADRGPCPAVPRVSDAGIALIKRFEGLARRRPDGMIEAYPDPATGGDPWTIGWGATGPDIARGTVWSREQCDARLAVDVARHAAEVARAIGSAPTSQPQFDALTSFHYNTGAIARATLTRRHCTGDFAGAASEFARWNRAAGRIMPGLVTRRREEARLYSS